MPLLIAVNELQPGMRLAESFVWHGVVMLPGGKTLGNDDVDILSRKYPDQCLKISDPILDSLADFEDDSKERQVAQTCTQRITQYISTFQQRISHHTDIGQLNFSAIRSTTAAVLHYLKNNPAASALLDKTSQPGSPLSKHAGNVFYLSLMLGSAVRHYVLRERHRQAMAANLSCSVNMDLLPLGLGAMFADIGMTPMQYIFEPGNTLTADDRLKIRGHPDAGAAMLPDDVPATVKTIVRTHHENFDGTGYPNGIKGADLHVFARIVRICDAFDAGTSQKAYAKAKSVPRVLWEMCAGPHQHCYDPVLAKMFISIIQPFPIGAKLQLEDGRRAVVVRYNRRQPFCPFVVIAFDEKNQRLDLTQLESPVYLAQDNELRIASYAGEDLSMIYGTPLVEVPAEHGTMLEMAYP